MQNGWLRRRVIGLGLVALALIAAPAAAAGAAEPEGYATLTYPLRLNYTNEAGTIELWVRPDRSTAEAIDRFYQFFVFRLSLGEGLAGQRGAFALMWKPGTGLTPFGEGASGEKLKNLPSPLRAMAPWGADEWHHVAFTWEGPRLAVYADGELVRTTRASDKLPPMQAGLIVLGFGDSAVAVDEFCLSSVARSAEAIRERMAAPIEPDEYTLVLDGFESPDAAPAERKLLSERYAETVEGRHGQAMRLFGPRKESQ